MGKKKLLSVLLAAVMAISLLPTAVFAADGDPVAKVGDQTYATLAEAVKAVTTSESKTGTVTLLKDAEGAGIGLFNADGEVGVNLTIDLGGNTYTCVGPAVGSLGTESQALHLEKGNTVMVKNGTFAVAEGQTGVKMLIQNYCNLTLMDLDLVGSSICQYIISCNYGDTRLSNVNITGTHSKVVAIDVMHWLGTSYEDKAPTMVIDNTTENSIKGSIDVYCYGTSSTGTTAATCTQKAKLTINGGTYTDDPTEFLAEGRVAALADGVYTVHTPVKTDAKPATCTEAGNTAYWSCSDCGKYYADAECTKEITLADTVVAATGHSYVDGVCTVCGDKIATSTPSVDPTKPVEEVTVGVDQDSAAQLNEETGKVVDEIIAGTSTAVSKETADAVNTAINEGKTISTAVEFQNTQPSKDDSKKAFDLLGTTDSIAQFFDLSIVIKADGQAVGNIEQLSKPMTFQIAIPADLVKENREYFIIRIHNGVAEKLPATLLDNGMLSFQTDRFSTYALAYTDSVAEDTDKEEVSEVPETGENNQIAIWFALLAFSFAGVFGAAIFRNKKRTNH